MGDSRIQRGTEKVARQIEIELEQVEDERASEGAVRVVRVPSARQWAVVVVEVRFAASAAQPQAVTPLTATILNGKWKTATFSFYRTFQL